MIKLRHFDRAAQRSLVEARRQTRLSGRRTIASRQLLAGCLVDEQVCSLMAACGVSTDAVLTKIGGSHRRSELLGAIGIDARRVENAIPPGGPTTALRLRRWVTRPLRITLGHPPAQTPFAGSGRKVLEVALWNARHRGGPASPFDLLRGILADRRDAAYHAVAESADDGVFLLLTSLYSEGCDG